MKPLKSNFEDADTLRELGLASVQIVHDLKNQLNGLKLYATFLRKRMEKSGRPADELETVGKLLAGLERAASDMTTLVRLGRPLELRRQPGTDLARLLESAADGAPVRRDEAGPYEGEFDPAFLSEALKNITSDGAGAAAAALGQKEAGAPQIHLRREGATGRPLAVIEWRGVAGAAEGAGDLFQSFAGGRGLRLALAAKVIKAHGGEVEQEAGTLRARLPLAP